MATSQSSSGDTYLHRTTPHGYTSHESRPFSHTLDTVSVLSSSNIATDEVGGVGKEISLNQALFNELRSQEALGEVLSGQPLPEDTLPGELQDRVPHDVMELEPVSGDAESLRFHYQPMDDLLLSQVSSPPSASSKKKGGQAKTVYREQDRFVPLHNVARIMRHAIPANGKVSKDAKECMQECVSECVSFITSEASDKCIAEKRKTINGDDILFAMATLGFDNYVEPLKLYLQKYREFTRADKSPSILTGRDAT